MLWNNAWYVMMAASKLILLLTAFIAYIALDNLWPNMSIYACQLKLGSIFKPKNFTDSDSTDLNIKTVDFVLALFRHNLFEDTQFSA